ncbi:MAG TPA: hypothetical protein VG758_31160 [Hyphomicrobiaceae bacterium]|jgi:hypothetical protein|nr:hypothetical protein [Hyphomicrobiaceae bacterium]
MAEFLSDNIFYLLPLFLLFPFAMMALTNRLYAQYRLDNMAQRMGLTIAEGNPKLNMVNAIPVHNFKWGKSTGSNWLSRLANSTKETKVRLGGAPHGRPTEFVYFRREDTKEGLLTITTNSWFECRMSVQVPVAFPEFEIVRRRPHLGVYGPKARPELPLPPQPFGNRALDSKLVLTAAEPRLGPALASAASGLAALEYVHVQGRDGALHWLATEEGSPHAVRRLPEAQQVLERIADVLAGPVQRPQ